MQHDLFLVLPDSRERTPMYIRKQPVKIFFLSSFQSLSDAFQSSLGRVHGHQKPLSRSVPVASAFCDMHVNSDVRLVRSRSGH